MMPSTPVFSAVAARFNTPFVLALLVVLACEPQATEFEPVGDDGDFFILEREGIIGSVDVPGDVLSTVDQARLGPKGSLYVAQPDEHLIRVFNREGSLTRTFGGRGEGPGEITALSHMNIAGDTVYVSDNALGRLTLFSSRGELIRSVQWSVSLEPGVVPGEPDLRPQPTVPQVVSSEGFGLLLPHVVVAAPPARAGTRELAGVVRIPFVRAERDRGGVDTLAWHVEEVEAIQVAYGSERFILDGPFGDYPLAQLAVDGSGVVFVRRRAADSEGASRFQVGKVNVDGDTAWVRSLRYRATAISPSVLEREARSLEEFHGTFREEVPSTSEIEEALHSAGLVPQTVPPVSNLRTTSDGSIWLRREHMVADSVQWQILDSRGGLCGGAWLPGDQIVMDASKDRLVTLGTGPVDIPRLFLYRGQVGGTWCDESNPTPQRVPQDRSEAGSPTG